MCTTIQAGRLHETRAYHSGVRYQLQPGRKYFRLSDTKALLTVLNGAVKNGNFRPVAEVHKFTVTFLKVLIVDIQSPCAVADACGIPVAMQYFVTRVLITIFVCNLPVDL